jgi:hypothetical protein
MILKRINFYWCYLFFSAYWTAFSLGEKKEPESNANYLLSVIIGLNLFGIFEFIKYLGYNLPIIWLVIICVVPAITIPYYSFKMDSKYKKKLIDFDFLKTEENKKKRHTILLLISIWSVFFVALGGILRM